MNRTGLSIRDKLIISLINIILIVSIAKGSYAVLGLYGIFALIVMIIFKPDYRRLPKRILAAFIYPLCVSIFIPFVNPGNIVASIDLRLFTVTITDIGLTIFFTVLIKAFLSILIIASLMLSADEKEIFHGLRKIKVPAIIVSIMFLMYRYIFLIREEARTGQMAINSRIFGRSYYSANKKLTYLMGNMLIKSFDRAENIYKSMESRGFNGEFHSYESSSVNTVSGIALLLLFTIIPASLKIMEIVKVI